MLGISCAKKKKNKCVILGVQPSYQARKSQPEHRSVGPETTRNRKTNNVIKELRVQTGTLTL